MEKEKENAILELFLEEAVFEERISRFSAWVIWRGERVLAHVPNSGRLKELLRPGVRARVRPGGGTKTVCRLMMVEYENAWVLIDSHITNDIMEYAVRTGWLMKNPFDIRREVKFGESRLDLGCRNEEGFHLVEAKCVTLVKDGAALFPDAPTQRGARHLQELKRAAENGFYAHAAFFVQQAGAEYFCANKDMDENFADALEAAAAGGVQIHVIECRILENGIELRRELPWIYSKEGF